MEDHNHPLKRIAQHVGVGSPAYIDLRHFEEAMKDPSTDLTRAVPQAVSLWCWETPPHAVASFFYQKEYAAEATFVRTIARCHETIDGTH